jgi:hypothetical protein
VIRQVVEADEVVGVKMFKIKIMSNIISHTLKENISGSRKEVREQTYSEILRIVKAFKENQYRK